jgi:tape measure domain-containing protein
MAVANVDIRVNSGPAVAMASTKSMRHPKAATTGVNGLKAAIAPLLSAFVAMQAVKFVFAKTSELETQTKSLEVLTGSVEKATKIIAELTQLGAVTPFTSTELIDAAKRLQAFGVEGDKVVETTRRLADVSGATGAELQGLVTAYGQVQAKGRLQGEELLQFQERGIGLQQELRKMYGMTGDEFQKALSKGRIGAEAVEVAIVRLTNKGGKYANGAIAQSDTLSGKFSTLQDGIDQVARAIGTGLTPALKGALNVAIDLVTRMGQAFAAASITESEKKGMLEKATGAIQRDFGPFAGGAFGTGEVKMVLGGKTYKGQPAAVAAQMANDMINAEVGRRALAGLPKGASKPAGTDPPKLREETDSGTKGKSGQAAQDKAANEAKQLAERLRTLDSETILNQKLVDLKQLQFNAGLAEDQQLLIRLKGNEEILKIAQKTRQEIGGGTTNVVVNVDASGSSVESDQSQAKALGNAISAAVQSELVKQKRPGGLLA